MPLWAGPLFVACTALIFYLELRFAFMAILLDEALIVVLVAVFGMTLWVWLWPLTG